MKESRNRDKERKIQRKGSKFWMKGVNFKKKLSMIKKRYSEIFENRRGFLKKKFWMLSENIFSQNFCTPIFVTQIFGSPIFMTSLRRCISYNFLISSFAKQPWIWTATDLTFLASAYESLWSIVCLDVWRSKLCSGVPVRSLDDAGGRNDKTTIAFSALVLSFPPLFYPRL